MLYQLSYYRNLLVLCLLVTAGVGQVLVLVTSTTLSPCSRLL